MCLPSFLNGALPFFGHEMHGCQLSGSFLTMNILILSRLCERHAIVRWLGLVCLLSGMFLTIQPLSAEGLESHQSSAPVLRVGTKITPPMVIKNANGEWEGISIQLWKHVAAELGWHYEFVEMPLTELLQSVENGQLDAVVAALTITAEREKKVDFSQPFFMTGLSVAVRHQDQGQSSVLAILSAVFSWKILQVVGWMVASLFVIGVGFWLFEHRRNPQHFGGSLLRGLGSGFWFSAVTMTTVGYGDKTPTTLGGRILALFWMFTSVIVISIVTASITSSLTVERLGSMINHPNDLVHVRTATVTGSTSAAWLKDNHFAFAEFKTLEEALKSVQEKQYDAVVYDEPLLRYLTLNAFQDLQVLPITFHRQNYGIAFPNASWLREPVNWVLLKELQEPAWDQLIKQYMGKENP